MNGAFRDEIQSLFNVAWVAGTPSLNGGNAAPIAWPGVDVTPDPLKPWARYQLKENLANQATLAPVGSRRFDRLGLILIQVFAPISKGGGVVLADQLAEIARSAYEGKGTASGIWFLNCRVNDIGVDKNWYQKNMIAEFRFQELH